MAKPLSDDLREYSPDLNPSIEKLFSKIKHWLRKVQCQNLPGRR